MLYVNQHACQWHLFWGNFLWWGCRIQDLGLWLKPKLCDLQCIQGLGAMHRGQRLKPELGDLQCAPCSGAC